MRLPWQGWRRPLPRASPARSLQREQRILLLLYLASLAGVLLIVAAVVRGVFHSSEWSHLRSRLLLIGEDLSSLPLPEPGTERDLQESRKDFATAHQQVEWFRHGRSRPVARLGEVLTLGPLPPRRPGQHILWQEGPDWVAMVRPLDDDGGTHGGTAPVWLRISEGLDPLHERLRRLDLALATAVLLALLLSGVSAVLLARRAVAPLDRSLRRLRQFSLDASHELRGPLAALSANAEMGLLDCPSGQTEQRRRFEAIASACGQMEQLVEDLLLLARQDERPLAPPGSVDLSALLLQQLALLQDGIARRGLRLEAEIGPGLKVLGHAALLQRLFRNLLDNACRYNAANGSIQVHAFRHGGAITVAVIDSGIGLSREELPQVFDRFWRASPERGDGGSGLGLAIAARICQAHGGRIAVTSRPGQGSRFEVELPASDQPTLESRFRSSGPS